MQVMNSTEFEQRNLLVGQKSASASYGVSSDPMLMGMLSTGLYSRPFRTMIQEIMFNAWDAHRMGNCQDKPIDVYIDDTTGLMVRDYGPGIHPEDMIPIYCIYGASTKRNDKGQTGGFGLGSKSPFAYSDSFTVTSFHDGTKNMYLMNRVSKENDGAPGMTPLVADIPTEETGLLVTIPLKSERDIEVAYEHIKDVLYLSGIKVNIHYRDRDVEYIESEVVSTKGFFNSEEHSEFSYIIAVYGGVRYQIEDHADFEDSFREVLNISRILGTTYIGFPPDSLTPLPNREGLNMSDKTIESIKSRFELIIESFQASIVPVLHKILEFNLEKYSTFKIKPENAIYIWSQLGNPTGYSRSAARCTDLYPLNGQQLREAIKDMTKPDSVSDNMWATLSVLCYTKTDKINELIGKKHFEKVKRQVFLKKYPEMFSTYSKCTERFTAKLRPSLVVDDYDSTTKTKLIKDFTEANKLTKKGNLTLRRYSSHNNYEIMTNVRGELNVSGKYLYKYRGLPEGVLAYQTKKKKHGSDKRTFTDTLWYKRSAEPVNDSFMRDTIILCKKVGTLNEFKLKEDTVCSMFTPMFRDKFITDMGWHHRVIFDPTFYIGDRNLNARKLIPAIVTGVAKDTYETVKKHFTKLGYKIIEVGEPVKQKKLDLDDIVIKTDDEAPTTPRGPVTYPKFQYSNSMYSNSWTGGFNEIQIEKPEAYILTTQREIEAQRYRNADSEIFRQIEKRWPNTVVLLNKGREASLIKKRVPHVNIKIKKEVETLLSDKQRISNMVLYQKVSMDSGLPAVLLQDFPELQKAIGLPYIRTNHREKFFSDFAFLDELTKRNTNYFYRLYSELSPIIKNAFDEAKAEFEPKTVRAISMLRILDTDHLTDMVDKMKKGERKLLSEKIVRFLRTV